MTGVSLSVDIRLLSPPGAAKIRIQIDRNLLKAIVNTTSGVLRLSPLQGPLTKALGVFEVDGYRTDTGRRECVSNDRR